MLPTEAETAPLLQQLTAPVQDLEQGLTICPKLPPRPQVAAEAKHLLWIGPPCLGDVSLFPNIFICWAFKGHVYEAFATTKTLP